MHLIYWDLKKSICYLILMYYYVMYVDITNRLIQKTSNLDRTRDDFWCRLMKAPPMERKIQKSMVYLKIYMRIYTMNFSYIYHELFMYIPWANFFNFIRYIMYVNKLLVYARSDYLIKIRIHILRNLKSENPQRITRNPKIWFFFVPKVCAIGRNIRHLFLDTWKQYCV